MSRISNISLMKFFGDRGGPEHGDTRLNWPGTLDGFPVRSNTVPNLKQDELEDLPLQMDYKSEMFELWDPAQKTRYDKIKDYIQSGLYLQIERRVMERPDKHHIQIWLEWAQVYGVVPDAPGGSARALD